MMKLAVGAQKWASSQRDSSLPTEGELQPRLQDYLWTEPPGTESFTQGADPVFTLWIFSEPSHDLQDAYKQSVQEEDSPENPYLHFWVHWYKQVQWQQTWTHSLLGLLSSDCVLLSLFLWYEACFSVFFKLSFPVLSYISKPLDTVSWSEACSDGCFWSPRSRWKCKATFCTHQEMSWDQWKFYLNRSNFFKMASISYSLKENRP